MKGLNKITCCCWQHYSCLVQDTLRTNNTARNFNNADIRQFVGNSGSASWQNDPDRPFGTGTISVRSNDTFSQQEYYQFFGILDLYGYSVITLTMVF